MDYAQQRDPAQHLVGITLVVVLHIFIVYALVNGLARKAIDVLKQPLEVNLIEESKPLPPPPVQKVIRVIPPTYVPPPPVYIPPPEVKVEVPAPPASVVTTSVAPPPVEVTPTPVPVAKVEPPAVVDVGVACPNYAEVRNNMNFPEQALRMGLSGQVLVEFSLDTSGVISGINIVNSSSRLFNSAATNAVSKLHCQGQTQNTKVRVPFVFKLEN